MRAGAAMEAGQFEFLVRRVDAVIIQPKAGQQRLQAKMGLEGFHHRDRPAAADQRRRPAEFIRQGLARRRHEGRVEVYGEAGGRAVTLEFNLRVGGKPAVTKRSKLSRIFVGSCPGTRRKVSFAVASAGITVFVPSP